MTACDDLIMFADGELDHGRASEFRRHLLTCPMCRVALVEANQLDARLSDLGDGIPRLYHDDPDSEATDVDIAFSREPTRVGDIIPPRRPAKPPRVPYVLKYPPTIDRPIAVVIESTPIERDDFDPDPLHSFDVIITDPECT